MPAPFGMETASELSFKSNPALPRLNGPLSLPLMPYPLIATSYPMASSYSMIRMLVLQLKRMQVTE